MQVREGRHAIHELESITSRGPNVLVRKFLPYRIIHDHNLMIVKDFQKDAHDV
jgi:hypothetical protein